MDSILGWLFGTARFIPHGVCLLWRPDLVAIHVVSDSLIALSYFAIPGAIWWFVRRRTDLEPEHRRMALLFAIFITACGLTHVASIVTLWAPYYGLQALLKAVTAAVSLATAAALPFLVPKLLKIPSPRALETANASLKDEVAAHAATLAALQSARSRLEQEVADKDQDLRVINARFEMALTGSTATLIEQDEDLRYTWAFNSPYGAGGDGVIGKTERELMSPAVAERVQALKREALAANAVRRREIVLDPGGQEAWYDIRVQPTVLRDGRRGLIGLSSDVSVQKRQQAHLELVMRELNHRSKNLLTIVQSIARQTAAGLDVPEAFMQRLSERLRSLASAHDVLVQGDWRGADLQAVIESQLQHQLLSSGDRIRIDGDRFELPPEVAHYVALALHELGANASKYGALSSGAGQVSVGWNLAEAAEGPVLTLSWRERGGPRVSPPAVKGFGRTILEVLTPRALGGRAELNFAEEGVDWVMVAPMKALTPGMA